MDMELATGGTMVDMALAIGAMDTMESVMLMLSLRPRLMLTPTTMEATMAVAMDMELATGGTMVDMASAIGAMDTMESVMLRLSLRPRLMLTPTIMEATMAMAMDMELATGGTMVDMAWAIGAMDTMESVMLMLSLRPRLMLIPTTMEATMAMAMDTELATGGTMVDMALAIGAMDTMESVMLMLNLRPRLMLIPTTMEVTMDVDMDMELATGGTMVDMA